MKSKWFAFLVGASFAMPEALHGQGTFQNLDFEAALISPGQPSSSFVLPDIAFPRWAAYVGSNQVSFVVYNNITLSAANISVLATNYDPIPALEGRFSAYLQGSGDDGNFNQLIPPEVSLRQTGLVPASAQSLTFISGPLISVPFLYRSISVTFGGQVLPVVVLKATPDYTQYGANVSAFAGQTTELRFTSRAFSSPPNFTDMNAWLLDSISFSDQPIPEPETVFVFGLGALLLCTRFRKWSDSQMK